MVTRETVYKIISEERDYQDKQWGGRPHDDMRSVGDFLIFIDRYVTVAKEELTTKLGTEAALSVIRKITALGVACMEVNGAIKR